MRDRCTKSVPIGMTGRVPVRVLDEDWLVGGGKGTGTTDSVTSELSSLGTLKTTLLSPGEGQPQRFHHPIQSLTTPETCNGTSPNRTLTEVASSFTSPRLSHRPPLTPSFSEPL